MADEVIVGLFTLGGVVVGGAATWLVERATWRRSAALATRLLLADAYIHVWGDTQYSDFQVQMERLRAHLDSLGVGPALVERLADAIRQCRSSIESDLETGNFDPDYGPGLSQKLLDAYRKAVDDIIAKVR